MNNGDMLVKTKKKMAYNDCINVMMAYAMIVIWLLCIYTNNPYTKMVQAIWVLYVAVLNFHIFVHNRKKLSLMCTVFLLGYFIVKFIVIV